jgi:hypothetical protein
MKEKIEFKQIREFGDLIGDTMVFIKQNFKPLLKAFFTFCGIFILGSMVSSILTQLQMVDLFEEMRGGNVEGIYGNSPFNIFYNFGVNYVLLIIFVVLNYTAMYVTVLSYISIYIQKGNVAPTLPEIWTYFKFYFWRILGSGVLMTMFLGLCFMCCIVPFIYVFPAASLFYVVMIMENANFSHSFERPYKLLKGEWWITAATFLIIWVITYACSLIVQIPAGIVSLATTFTHLEQPLNRSSAIITAVCQHIANVFMIIPIIGATFIYFNLVERKESIGLLSRMEGLGQSSSTLPTENIPEEY